MSITSWQVAIMVARICPSQSRRESANLCCVLCQIIWFLHFYQHGLYTIFLRTSLHYNDVMLALYYIIWMSNYCKVLLLQRSPKHRSMNIRWRPCFCGLFWLWSVSTWWYAQGGRWDFFCVRREICMISSPFCARFHRLINLGSNNLKLKLLN